MGAFAVWFPWQRGKNDFSRLAEDSALKCTSTLSLYFRCMVDWIFFFCEVCCEQTAWPHGVIKCGTVLCLMPYIMLHLFKAFKGRLLSFFCYNHPSSQAIAHSSLKKRDFTLNCDGPLLFFFFFFFLKLYSYLKQYQVSVYVKKLQMTLLYKFTV